MKLHLLYAAALGMALGLANLATGMPQAANESSIIDPGTEWLSYGRTYR